MTIHSENPLKMSLHDGRYSRFLTAGGLILAGIVIACTGIRHNFAPVVVGVCFLGAGLFFLFTTKRVTIEIDKAVGKIRIVLQGIKSKDEKELAISEVQKIVLRRFIQSSSVTTRSANGGRSTSTSTYYRYIFIIVTKQNYEHTFDFGKVSAGLVNLIVSPDTKKKQDAEQVANFIGVPMEADMPSTGDVLSALKQGMIAGFRRAS